MKKINTLITILFSLSLLLIVSCASGNKGVKHGSYSKSALDPKSIEQLIQQTDLDEGSPVEYAANANGKTSTQKIPRVINESVKKWIKYFTVDNPDWYQRALSRSEEYETNIKNILIAYDVPEDLFYLALIESAFVQRAHSRAGAKGIWQFMKGTAKLYGLQVTRKNDERLNPYKATAAAAAYLRDLYNIYGSWYLAIASYNAGEGRIRDAIIRHRERNFWELASKNALPDETMNYVPKYIAAAIIGENPKLYGFQYNGPSKDAVMVAEDVSKLDQYRRGAVAVSSKVAMNLPTSSTKAEAQSTVETTVYKVKKGDNLSRIAAKNDTTIAQIRACNSRMKNDTVLIGQKLILSCSKATTGTVIAKVEQPQATDEETTVSVKPSKPLVKKTIYKVRYGDTLEAISKKFNTSVAQIKDCNPTVKRYEILAGQRLKVNCIPATDAATLAIKEDTLTHVVKSGESLWSISQKYDVKITDIMKWNNLKKRSKIFAGRKLKIMGKKKELS
ncbi:MAG: LysM peptidoglycan-binding domain-containing protein [Proteobacteria bacterium]|nr:LysM peptidoglycan-binding domain-containing protein [Pseudomonadota bacterium]